MTKVETNPITELLNRAQREAHAIQSLADAFDQAVDVFGAYSLACALVQDQVTA